MSVLDATISEAEWQQKVVDTAHLYGWTVAHFRSAKTQRKNGSVFHQTAVGADGKGFPDLVLVNVGTVLFVELKTETGRLSAEQRKWEDALRMADANYEVWRPSDWPTVLETLSVVWGPSGAIPRKGR